LGTKATGAAAVAGAAAAMGATPFWVFFTLSRSIYKVSLNMLKKPVATGFNRFFAGPYFY
jgi:hypothetical protein